VVLCLSHCLALKWHSVEAGVGCLACYLAGEITRLGERVGAGRSPVYNPVVLYSLSLVNKGMGPGRRIVVIRTMNGSCH